jgi:hypothetical protein
MRLPALGYTHMDTLAAHLNLMVRVSGKLVNATSIGWSGGHRQKVCERDHLDIPTNPFVRTMLP